jgi:hypothetical protein
MRAAALLAVTTMFILAAPTAEAGEEWKWGVNFYDLQLNNIPPPGSDVEADVCAAALASMTWYIMQDEPGSESIGLLSTYSHAWQEEAANRRGIDLETNSTENHIPAFGLMQQLEMDDHQFYVEYCLKLTQETVEAREAAE